MKTHQAMYAVTTMCGVLGVSTSGYYAWRKRKESNRRRRDRALRKRVEVIFWWSRGTYGAPRIQRELQAHGTSIGTKRVARLMRSSGLVGATRRKWTSTTVRDQAARPAPDLVNRNFTATGPNQLWVADITFVPTQAGFLYLAVVLDVWSRKIVGWSMQTHLRSDLVVAALDMAIRQRRPTPGLIHHSDQGCQYTSVAFGNRCRKAGVRPSMGSVGDCYDNALCESFFATLQCELLDQYRFRVAAEARAAIFSFIEGWYNQHRRHSSIGYLSPNNYELLHRKEHRPAN